MNWLDFLLDAATKSAVVVSAAAVIDWLFHHRSAASRHLIWTMAVVAALAMPALSALLPKWHVLPLNTSAQSAAPHVSNEAPPVLVANITLPANLPDWPSQLPSEVIVPQTPAVLSHSISWQTWMAAIWIAGSIVLLIPILIGMLSLTRLSRRARKIHDNHWLDLCGQIKRDLGLGRRIQLLQTADRAMPMTWGIWRSSVLLPAEADIWPPERQRLVLIHELAHVKRRDALAQLLAQTMRAAYWFNPLAWFALPRMARLREAACDDMVLNCGIRASDYAEELLSVAMGYRHTAGSLSAFGIAMARSPQLEGRLRAILNGRTDRRGLTRRAIILSLLLLAATVFPLAALGTRAAAQDAAQSQSQPQTPDAAAPTTTTDAPAPPTAAPPPIEPPAPITLALPQSTFPSLFAQKTAGDYKIAKSDEIAVLVRNLAGEGTGDHIQLAIVSDNGEVHLDFLPPLHVEGLTASQARAAIAKAYQDAGKISDGQVTVSVSRRTPDATERLKAEMDQYLQLGRQYQAAGQNSRRALTDQLPGVYQNVEAARIDAAAAMIDAQTRGQIAFRLPGQRFAPRPITVRCDLNTGWSAKFDNDVVVELLGVSEHPSKNRPWWKPNGQPMDAPYDDFGNRLSLGRDPLGREFAVRLTNPKDLPVDFSWHLDPPTSQLATGNLSRNGQAISDIRAAAATLAANGPATTLWLGVAADPWRAVGVQAHLDLSIGMKNPDGFGDILFAPVTQTADGLEETVSYTLSNQETRLMAITADGKELKSSWSSSSGQGSLGQMTARFKDLRPADVSEFVLEGRPYQWVVFENVSLWPK